MKLHDPVVDGVYRQRAVSRTVRRAVGDKVADEANARRYTVIDILDDRVCVASGEHHLWMPTEVFRIDYIEVQK